jgi:RNA polymerase sigma-70 factor (ECF subfamily)
MLNEEFCTRVASETPRLRRYALCLARDGDWAGDLVQETLVRAIDNADKFQAGTNLRSWLMTILHNIYVNEVKKRRPSLTKDGSVDRGLPVEGNQESRHHMRDVQRAFQQLSRQHRQIIRYICIEEMACRDVGRRLGVSEGTVRSRLCRARDRLRRLVEPAALA